MRLRPTYGGCISAAVTRGSGLAVNESPVLSASSRRVRYNGRGFPEPVQARSGSGVPGHHTVYDFLRSCHTVRNIALFCQAVRDFWHLYQDSA